MQGLYLVPTRVSHFNRLQCGCRCVAGSLPRFNVHLPFQLLATRREVHYQLSTSFRRASPISTACNTATGALPALYIVPMRDSYFNSLKYDYRFVAGSQPRSNACFPFQPLAIQRQVRYPALYLVPTRVFHFNRVQYGYRCVVSSLPLSGARLQFQLLAIWLPVRCPLSTWFRCASPYMFTASVNLFNLEYI